MGRGGKERDGLTMRLVRRNQGDGTAISAEELMSGLQYCIYILDIQAFFFSIEINGF